MIKANRDAIAARRSEMGIRQSAPGSQIPSWSAPVAITTAKIIALPRILEAAQLLYRHNLISAIPSDIVKAYVAANPDINELMSSLKAPE